MSGLFAEVIEGVLRHRLRAAATAFGVFWGTFMLTLLLGAGAGAAWAVVQRRGACWYCPIRPRRCPFRRGTLTLTWSLTAVG